MNSSKVEMLVMYKECMHNHAASKRDFLLNGCGVFEAPIGTTTGFRETMLCAECGCPRNFHRRIEVEIPPRHRSSSIRHHQQQQQPASHPDQQQQPALHPHQPQQPTSHHHRGGRGTMIIRRAPAPAPGCISLHRRKRKAAIAAIDQHPMLREIEVGWGWKRFIQWFKFWFDFWNEKGGGGGGGGI